MADPILIIGAGIGGLSAAIHLAAAGKRVLILEQNTAVGGKMSEWTAQGFRWDTGPSVITMRHVFEELFSAAGKRLEDYLTLLPVEPLTRYFFPDGTLLDFTRDLPALLRQIEQIDARDVEGFLNYLSYVARLHRITGPVFIYDEPPRPGSLLRVHPRDMLHVDAWRSMDRAIRSFVHSPQLRQLLGRFATYVGASPYRAPATLNVIAHVELNGGVWYPQGGIYAIARAMERLALELGVEIRTGTWIDQILVKDNRAAGVVLADGRTISGEAVIANVDVATVYEHLLPRTAQTEKRLRKLSRIEPSCSGFILMLGVEGQHPQLAHHNIFFSRDYPGEFRDIFERQRPPDDPTIYVAITSKADPDHAPAGHENWFVLVNAPACTPDFDWREAQQSYREVVLDRLREYGLDIRRSIRVERILTPADLETMTGARRGALYGSSSNNPLAAFLRPHNQDPLIRNLYYAGGTTHPGGGVPMVTLSGKLAARLILKKV
ncbi:MAG: phytoene desaturase [Anaerolineae bacterium]|nr:phytoene desaturase [Anaerolineae bacterium]